ncbi:MAG TPA: hypothetical protein VHJ19_13285 [Gammaproteobacteria bacterium]|nr:hypothetical protein [Gammaproteobacteria bacterium]
MPAWVINTLYALMALVAVTLLLIVLVGIRHAVELAPYDYNRSMGRVTLLQLIVGCLFALGLLLGAQ